MVLVYLWAPGLALLLTPTGRLPSPRWRWLARVAAGALGLALLASALSPAPLYPEYPDVGSPIGVAALGNGPLAATFPLCALIVLASLVAGAGSLVGRFRRAHGVERQQLRWLALAAAVAAGLLVVALADLAFGQGSGSGFVLQASLAGCVTLLPLATGAAILRYRLYDLDRIVSRTVAWGLLSVLLGLGYAVALRRRPHGGGFAARLRDQVDLDALHGELLAVVDQTMQPTRTSLWLRPTVPAAGGGPAGQPP